MKLSIGNLVVKFNDNPFLGPINAVFNSGSLNLIVGRSGCGKSTLLKLIAGFHKDFTGAVALDEDYFEPEGNVALAFQNPEALFFNSTVPIFSGCIMWSSFLVVILIWKKLMGHGIWVLATNGRPYILL